MSSAGATRRNRWIVAVLAVCAVLYFLRLGEVAFLGKDEPKNAQAAREMLHSGDRARITCSRHPARFVELPPYNHFDTLRAKLGWGAH